MELKSKDTYRSECAYGISEDGLSSLMCLYQPLCGPEAIILYLTLFAEAKNPHAQQSHSRLLSLTSLSLDVLERARTRLEEYMLIRTYVKESDNKNMYLYVLHQPLNAIDFAQSSVYMHRAIERVGQKQMELTLSSLQANQISKNGYKDVTHVVKHLKNQDETYDDALSTIQPKYSFAVDDESIVFDYEKFIATTSTLVFPAELRSQENLQIIGKMATVYGLSVDQMRVLVKRCTNISTMEFDADALRLLAAKEQPTVMEAKDPYDLPPVSFLQAKANGASVSLTDKKILEHLSLDMHFSNPVINVMIEYILKVSQNRLNPKFVDMVASEWARDGIETKEQALLETKKQIQSRPRNTSQGQKVGVPTFMREQAEGKEKKTNKASKETLEMIKQKQKELGDSYE